MRVIRSAGQNVSPSDDGRLFDQIFTDGLFEETTITHLGANNVALGAMYGIICGRDFTTEAQTVAVEMPEDDAGTTGYIYIEIDTSSDDVITIGTALAPFTPTYEDLNTNGAVAQMIIARYTASAVAVTSITAVYPTATAGDILPGSIAPVEESPTKTAHGAGSYILYNGQFYRVSTSIAAGETLTIGGNITATSVNSELITLINRVRADENDITTANGNISTLQSGLSNTNGRVTALENSLSFRTVTPTASVSQVSITFHSVRTYGKLLFFSIGFTTSAQISQYSSLISLGNKAESAWIAPVYTSGYVPTNYSIYGDRDNQTIRAGTALPAGSYRISGSLLIQ